MESYSRNVMFCASADGLHLCFIGVVYILSLMALDQVGVVIQLLVPTSLKLCTERGRETPHVGCIDVY